MFSFQSIPEYHSSLKDGRTSCYAAVEHYLQQIENSRHLNAFVHVFADEALEQARLLDERRVSGKPPGHLHGVVVAIKDVISYKNHPVSASSSILKNFTAIYNATAVQRLLDDEAIIIGSTNCDEFAMGSTNENSAYGKVLNALDTSRVPGGSSGGSAVAVQADCCMVSLGTDTGGSVRQPADFCGVIGLKPTYGRISRYGLIAYASSFDQIGIFGKTIPDVGLVLESIAGPDEFDSTASKQPIESQKETPLKKIGYFPEALENEALDPEIASSIKALIDQLKLDGYLIEPIHFEYLDYIVPTYYILTTAEASSNLSRFDGVRYGYRAVDKNGELDEMYKRSRSDGFGKEVQRRIMLGTFVLSAGYYDAYFSKAQQVRRLLVDKTALIFSEYDAIILPTAPSTAFKIGEKTEDPIAMYIADIFTVFANLTGIPSISIPLFWHSNGLPYGLQVMTNRFTELSLLHLSESWMQRYRQRSV